MRRQSLAAAGEPGSPAPAHHSDGATLKRLRARVRHETRRVVAWEEKALASVQLRRKRYEEKDFNNIIEIKEREAFRVNLMMGMIDQREKTLVFCATQAHAGMIRDLINQTRERFDDAQNGYRQGRMDLRERNLMIDGLLKRFLKECDEI